LLDPLDAKCLASGIQLNSFTLVFLPKSDKMSKSSTFLVKQRWLLNMSEDELIKDYYWIWVEDVKWRWVEDV
jgi:hypothetical protein